MKRLKQFKSLKKFLISGLCMALAVSYNTIQLK